jgi:transposase
MAQSNIITAGIDTAKDKLDVALQGQPRTLTIPNTKQGFIQLVAHLAKAGVSCVGIEATGKYQRPVTRHLEQAGLRVFVIQPLHIKAFAGVQGQRAKSDPIDAKLIAAFTALFHDQLKLPPEARFDALADALCFVEQIEDDIVRFKNRLEQATNAGQRRFYTNEIKRFTQRRDAALRRLGADLRKHPDLAQRVTLLLSIPTIGERTAISLVIRMPELGQVSREQAAAIAGLAPFVRQSGTWKGQTHIGGGRTGLRRALYMPAMAGATRHNPVLKAFYARLIAAGKPAKSALTACMRKLLTIANAVVARGTPWHTPDNATAL